MTSLKIKANAPQGANAYDTEDEEYFKWDGETWKYWDVEKEKWFTAILDPLYIGLNIKPL